MLELVLFIMPLNRTYKKSENQQSNQTAPTTNNQLEIVGNLYGKNNSRV